MSDAPLCDGILSGTVTKESLSLQLNLSTMTSVGIVVDNGVGVIIVVASGGVLPKDCRERER